MRSWQIGDLLLWRGWTVEGFGDGIMRVQLLDYDEEDARWTHASMYAGNGMLIDATFPRLGSSGGVRLRPVSDLVPGAHVRLRRDVRLTREQQFALLRKAHTLLGERYSVTRIIELYVRFTVRRAEWLRRMVEPVLPAREDDEVPGYVCSDIYAAAYMAVTFGSIRGRGQEHMVVSPAALSRSNRFTDVPVTWCAIP